jgi:hypothetical protein
LVKIQIRNETPNLGLGDLPPLSTRFAVDRESGKGSRTSARVEAEPRLSCARAVAMTVHRHWMWIDSSPCGYKRVAAVTYSVRHHREAGYRWVPLWSRSMAVHPPSGGCARRRRGPRWHRELHCLTTVVNRRRGGCARPLAHRSTCSPWLFARRSLALLGAA